MTTQTRISDLVANPGVLSNIVTKRFASNNTVVRSGLAVTGPEVDLLMTGGSQIQSLNFVNKVDTSTYNHSSDDFDEKGADGKITASPYMALRQDMNWGWATTDLTRMITKFAPNGAAADAIPLFWDEVTQKIVVASAKGAAATNAAMTISTTGSAFSIDKLIDAGATMSDPQARKTIACSRKTLAKMQKANVNAYVPAAQTNLGFATFADHAILLTEAFGDDTALVAQEGAFVFAAGLVPGTIGMETERDASGGNGGGGEILHTRLSMVTNPQGFSYAGTVKPSLTTLANSASWTMTASIEDIGFRLVKFTA